MTRFIIAYGWESETDIIDAPSLEDARQEAANRSMRLGLLDDDLCDTTWAQPYEEGLAFDLGLTEDEPDRPLKLISLRG